MARSWQGGVGALLLFLLVGAGANPSASAATAAIQPRREVSVRAFGAIGDGASDDTAAFDSAIAAAAGGTVIIPGPAVYSVRGVAVNMEGTRLVGAGEPTVRLQPLHSGDASPVFAVTASHVSFEGIWLDGNKQMQPQDGFSDSWAGGRGGTGRAFRAGIRVALVGRVLRGVSISRCRFKNTFGAAVAVRDVDDVVVKESHFEDNNFESLFASTTYVHGSGRFRSGIAFEQNETMRAQSGDASVNANEGIISRYRYVTWSHNRSDTTERGTKFEGCEHVLVSRNKIRNVTLGNFSALKLQFEGRDIQVVDNDIQGVGRGIDVLWAKGGLGFSNVTIARNVIIQTTGKEGDGIQVAGLSPHASDLVIEGNRIEGVARYGIYIAYYVDVDGLEIRRNLIRAEHDGVRLVPLGRWDRLAFAGNDINAGHGHAFVIGIDLEPTGRNAGWKARGGSDAVASASSVLRSDEPISAVVKERQWSAGARGGRESANIVFSMDGQSGVRRIRVAYEAPTVLERSDGVVFVVGTGSDPACVLLPREPESERPYVLVDMRADDADGQISVGRANTERRGDQGLLTQLPRNGMAAMWFSGGTWSARE